MLRRNSFTHVNRPSSTRFRARARDPGCRRYRLIGPRTKSYPRAIAAMAKEFALGRAKRADVIMTADYYDPVVLCELVRR